MTKTIYLTLAALLLSAPTHAEELVGPVSLSASHEAGELIEDQTLRLAAGQETYQAVLEIPEPGITSSVYALKGMIRYDSVEGDAYLQMDNHFEGHGTFFTKSLAPSGPLQKISGSSEWREFVLPFYSSAGDETRDTIILPDQLSLSLFMPGSGTVFLRDVGLYQYAAGEDPLGGSGFAGSGRVMGLFGAIAGSLVGIWGALIGTLASRGKARVFAIGSANLLIALGIAAAIAGLIALFSGQAPAAYGSLLWIGLLLAVVVGSIRRILPKRYEDFELKKMQAMDA